MEEEIRSAIDEVCTTLGLPKVDFVVEHPTDLSHGDYASNVAMVAAKSAGKNPRVFAEEIVEKLSGTIAQVAKIEIAGPGFINFFLTRDFFKEKIAEALAQEDAWGRNKMFAKSRIMVEYTQPNPFKVFHIGHLMSNAIGESISRIIEACGATVFRANYQGDVGLHIGKTLYGLCELGYDPTDVEKVGEAYAYGHDAYEEREDSRRHIIALTKKVYNEDPEIMDTYTRGRDASLKHFDALYARLGSTFDAFFFESETWKKGKELVLKHVGDVFKESEGAVVYKGEKDGLHTRVFINSEGVTTYEAKDIGLAFLKRETWEFDTNITVTAVEQNEYFKVIFTVLEKLDPWFAGRMKNVAHGMMMLPEGKMSSRKGNVVTGESILNEACRAAQEKIEVAEDNAEKETLADMIGVAALKYTILKQSLGKNIVYDQERALSFEGDSGPYLQYTCARITSVMEKATAAGVISQTDHAPVHAYPVELLLYRYPEVVQEAAHELEPHVLVTYLTELASAFNTFYATEKIADPNDAHAPYKLALSEAVQITLKNGLWVLGITAPDRM